MDVLSVIMALVVVAVSCLVLFVVKAFQRSRIFKELGLPALTPWPIVGNVREMMSGGGFFEFHKRYYHKYATSKAYGLFESNRPVMVLRDLDMVRDVMVKNFNSFPNRRVFSSTEPFDHALTQIKDDHWRHVRNTVSPTFSSGKLKRMCLHVEENAKALTSHLHDSSQSAEDVDVKDVVSCYTMDVIASTGFGVKLDSLKDRSSRFVKEAYTIVNGSGKLAILMFFFPFLGKILRWFGIEAFPKKSVQFFTSFVDEVIQNRSSDKTQVRNDFLQLVMEEERKQDESKTEDVTGDTDKEKRKGLSHLDLQGQAFIFILAGYDTVSSAMSFAMFLLAHHPDACAKAQEEIDRVLEGKFPTYESVQTLTYLDMCLNEAMRMYPPGFILDRVCNQDTELQGIKIPKGMLVMIPVMAIHTDPNYYPDPDKFDPERFTPENKASRHPFAHLPFGQGPRNCIAMRLALLEMKIAMAAILQEMTPVPCAKSVYPPKIMAAQLKAEDGLWVKMVSRKQD